MTLPEDGNAHPPSEIDRLIHEPARFTIMAHLYVVESAEAAGYVVIDKEFRGKKPHTMLCLSDNGRAAFQSYRKRMQQTLEHLPD